MSWILILLISIGLSLDVYAVTTVEGAMLARVEKKKLAIMVLIFCLWQFVSVMAGSLITLIPFFDETASGLTALWTIFSTVIFFALSAFMFYKCWRREPIQESVKEISYKNVCVTAIIVSLDAFFAGIGMGFLGAQILVVGLMLEIITVLCVIGGVYTGYRLGYEQKTKVLFVGACVLLAASIDVVIRYFVI